MTHDIKYHDYLHDLKEIFSKDDKEIVEFFKNLNKLEKRFTPNLGKFRKLKHFNGYERNFAQYAKYPLSVITERKGNGKFEGIRVSSYGGLSKKLDLNGDSEDLAYLLVNEKALGDYSEYPHQKLANYYLLGELVRNGKIDLNKTEAFYINPFGIDNQEKFYITLINPEKGAVNNFFVNEVLAKKDRNEYAVVVYEIDPVKLDIEPIYGLVLSPNSKLEPYQLIQRVILDKNNIYVPAGGFLFYGNKEKNKGKIHKINELDSTVYPYMYKALQIDSSIFDDFEVLGLIYDKYEPTIKDRIRARLNKENNLIYYPYVSNVDYLRNVAPNNKGDFIFITYSWLNTPYQYVPESYFGSLVQLKDKPKLLHNYRLFEFGLDLDLNSYCEIPLTSVSTIRLNKK